MRQYGLLRNVGFIITALLRDPYEELAERLVFINLLANSKASHLLPQFVSDIQPVVDFARELPVDDHKAMVTKFRTITRAQGESISNPMTRVFACGIDEHPEHRHICTALDNLAGMDVVGVWSRFPEFRSVLADVLGADVIGQDEPEIFEKVQEVRELLAGIGIVSDLLEHDLNLYAHASQAINVGLDGL
jgi:hypothetical protein